jgi:hypothetical protein
MAFPTPIFTEWFPWRFIDGGAPADLDTKLRRVGCYLLARFDGDPPAGHAEPANPRVFYIGETHGNTTSLRGRLLQFGTSAGLYGGQWNGSYAAWRYPREFPIDVVGEGEGGAGKACSSKHVYVALCAVPDEVPRHLHGIFPTAVEQHALWRHAEFSGRNEIPVLNNSGRRATRVVPAMPVLADVDLSALLAWRTDRENGEAAALRISQMFALALGYDPDVTTTIRPYGCWRGAERALEKGDWFYVGWSERDAAAVTLSVYRGHRPLYDGGAARTRDELRAMLQAFWEAWHA